MRDVFTILLAFGVGVVTPLTVNWSGCCVEFLPYREVACSDLAHGVRLVVDHVECCAVGGSPCFVARGRSVLVG